MLLPNQPPPLDAVPWSIEEEMELVALQSSAISVADTALGVATTQMVHAVVQNLGIHLPGTRAKLTQYLEEGDNSHVIGTL
jgi:hypothetical protein